MQCCRAAPGGIGGRWCVGGGGLPFPSERGLAHQSFEAPERLGLLRGAPCDEAGAVAEAPELERQGGARTRRAGVRRVRRRARRGRGRLSGGGGPRCRCARRRARGWGCVAVEFCEQARERGAGGRRGRALRARRSRPRGSVRGRRGRRRARAAGWRRAATIPAVRVDEALAAQVRGGGARLCRRRRSAGRQRRRRAGAAPRRGWRASRRSSTPGQALRNRAMARGRMASSQTGPAVMRKGPARPARAAPAASRAASKPSRMSRAGSCEGCAERGRSHARGGALEQRRAELALQTREEAAHARLGHVEALGGGADAPLLDEGEETDEVASLLEHGAVSRCGGARALPPCNSIWGSGSGIRHPVAIGRRIARRVRPRGGPGMTLRHDFRPAGHGFAPHAGGNQRRPADDGDGRCEGHACVRGKAHRWGRACAGRAWG